MPHGVTSIRKRLPQGISRPCGENAAKLKSSTEKKIRFARSARTRRSFRSRRVEPGRTRNHGVVGKMHLVQCRDDSVKHVASPSHRDRSRRVIHVASGLNLSPLLPNIEMSGAATPRTSVRLVSTCLPASRSLPLLWSGAAFPSFRNATCARRNLDTGQPFSHRYELRTQLRLESVATRTPPPICTSAQGSQTALILRTFERCEQFEPTRWLGSDNHGISQVRRLFASVATLHVRCSRATT